MNRKALGKGINALIPNFETEIPADAAKAGMVELLVDEISPGETQPRKDFNDEKLKDLENSIRENGVIQPIVVQMRGATINGAFYSSVDSRCWRTWSRTGN